MAAVNLLPLSNLHPLLHQIDENHHQLDRNLYKERYTLLCFQLLLVEKSNWMSTVQRLIVWWNSIILPFLYPTKLQLIQTTLLLVCQDYIASRERKHPQFYIQLVHTATLPFTLASKNLSFCWFKPKLFHFASKYKNSHFDLFCPWKYEKSRKIEGICSTALAHQMTQTVKFMFLNVAYRATVYKTGCVCVYLNQGPSTYLLIRTLHHSLMAEKKNIITFFQLRAFW